jgi:methyl-accepting chemotaxis protein
VFEMLGSATLGRKVALAFAAVNAIFVVALLVVLALDARAESAWEETLRWAAADQATQRAAAVADAHAAAGDARIVGIAAIVVGVLLGAGVAYWFGRALVIRVLRLRRVALRIAGGDVEQDVHVDSADELGQLAQGCAEMVASLRELADGFDRVSHGDLSVDVEPRSARDRLGVSFLRMTAGLRELVGEVAQSASAVSTSSQQMASTSEDAGRAVGEIASALGDVTRGAERQVRMVESTKCAAQETSAAADAARRVAEEGAAASVEASTAMAQVRETSGQVAAAIGSLADKSGEIGGIVSTITGIAEQTNLLALNAAIEAARAGDAGRGFAVVAEEVRKLAEESQRAAGSIAALIEQIQAETASTVAIVEGGARRAKETAATVDAAHESFERIVEQVRAVATRIEQIATATNEVAAVAEQSSASAEQVSASTEQTSASTQQIAASAQELARTAEQLEQLVGRFRLVAA